MRKDLATSLDGNLSHQIEMRLVAVLNDFKTSTMALTPSQWFGIGTSVFRKAKNGQEFLDRIKTHTGVTIHLASQIEEGEIGFMSAVASSGIDPNQVISWDIGNGSFQISSMNDNRFEMYGAEFAFVPALEVLIKTIRGQNFSSDLSANPITIDEALLLSFIIQNEKLPPLPDWLVHLSKKVVSFGGHTSIFLVGQIATGKESYTREDVLEAIKKFAGKTDDQLTLFPEPPKAVVCLSLLYAMMNHCMLEKMIFAKTNGGCEGLLIIPRFWMQKTDIIEINQMDDIRPYIKENAL